MKLRFTSYTQRFTALLIALCAVAVMIVAVFLIHLLGCKNPFLFVILVSLILFITVFFIAKSVLRIFILEKIRPIYKIIRSPHIPSFKTVAVEESNLIDAATRDAQLWADKKSEEMEHLKKQELFRKEYIGNIAHELKTPIFTIQGYVSTLLDGGLYDESVNRLYLERTDKVIQRMTMIVRDLDAINRLESGELKMEYSTFNIEDLILEIFESQEYLARERNVTLSIETDLPRPLMVYADRMRMSMALSNLIVNAIKYSHLEGGSVLVRFYDMEHRYLIEVSDNGIGIPKEYQERIFERFFRVDKSRSREQGGTGLGLAIVKHVIEAHGESISLKSNLDKGTSFSFTIKKGLVR